MLSFKNQRILIIAPHPDDEVFGCGGMIHRCKREGGQVYVLYLTVGNTNDFSKKGNSSKEERVKEVEKVAQFLQFDGYRIALPGDNYHLCLDAIPQKELINQIERGKDISLEAIRPSIVLTPPSNDYNQDHRAVSQALTTATRPADPTFKCFQKLVLTYEMPANSWSNNDIHFVPNFYITLNQEDLEAKIQALKICKSQLKHPQNPLSIHGARTQAQMRGLQTGRKFAEAFLARRLCI